MLRSIRRRIRLIRYYSARRPGSRWSRARDVALVASLPLAVAAAILMNAAVARTQVRDRVIGRVITAGDGAMKAIILLEEDRYLPWDGNVTPKSEFQLNAFIEDRGWPVTTSRLIRAPTLDIKQVSRESSRDGVDYDEEDPELRAIVDAMENAGRGELARQWMDAQSDHATIARGWVFGITLWMVMLWVFFILVIAGVRLLTFIFTTKKQIEGARHRARGHCAHCGYDLRGLEFHDRCPECGKLSW